MEVTGFAQIPLDLYLDEGRTFNSFYEGNNGELISSLQSLTAPMIFIWSEHGNGKSHLLQATCHYAEQQGLKAIYLPLNELKSFGPELLKGLDMLDLVSIDDIDTVLQNREWEEGLFHLYNQLRDNHKRIVVTSALPPQSLQYQLQDLASRFNWGMTYHLEALDDLQKAEAIHSRAQMKGLKVSSEVIQYIIHHLPRDPHQLFTLLDKLDKVSMAAKRPITIPLVKEAISKFN